MKTRLDLQAMLEGAMGNYSSNVWFKAPPNSRLMYPCIIYSYSGTKRMKADNGNYLKYRVYTVTLITDNPDSDLIEQIE